MPSKSVIAKRGVGAADSIEAGLQSLGVDQGIRETSYTHPTRDIVGAYSYALETVAALSAAVVALSERVTQLEQASEQPNIEQPKPKQSSRKKPTTKQ